MRYYMMILISMAIFAAALAGCGTADHGCTSTADCASRSHDECVGEWKCTEGVCAYLCQTPLVVTNSSDYTSADDADAVVSRISSIGTTESELNFTDLDTIMQDLEDPTW